VTDGVWVWYLPVMTRKRRSITTSPEIIDTIAELTRMTLDLHTRLIHFLMTNERAQRKFRTAVLLSLSKIETMVLMIHGAQIADAHLRNPHCDKEKMNKNAEDAEAYISQKSNELGMAMVKYIYRDDPIPEVRRDRRKKWHDWEI
jgi:hypothetical protein